MIGVEEYLNSFFSFFIRFVSFLILIPIAGGISSFVTKMILSFLFAYIAVFECGLTQTTNNYFYEILIGFSFSAKIFAKIYIITVIAEFFDAGRGANTSYVLNPTFGESQSYLSIFADKYIWLLWLLMGGLEESFKGVLDVTYFNLENQILNNTLFEFILESLMLAFKNSLSFLLVFFFCDISLCFIAKILNKWQIYTDLFILKTVVGFCILLNFISSY